MTLASAISFLSHTRPDEDLADVVRILCALATLAHALGNYRSRDDSIEAAAELIAGRVR